MPAPAIAIRAASPRAQKPRQTPVALWALALIGVVSAVLSFLRMTPAAAAAIWAEDGRDFIANRAASTFGADWLTPYAGYLHLVPRIVADVTVTFVPSPAWAWSMSIGSSLIVGLVSVAAFLATQHLLPWLPARIFLAFVPTLTPVIVDQVVGNAANLHTYFLWLIPFLFFVFPRRWWAAYAVGVLMLVSALTEIQAVIFAPLVFWRARDRTGWPARVGYIVGMGAQTFSALTSDREAYSDGPRPGLGDVAAGYVANGVGGVLTGRSSYVGKLIAMTGWGFLGLVAIVLLAALVYVVLRGTRPQRVLAGVLAYGSVASFAIGYVLNPRPGLYYSTYTPESWLGFGLLRYGVPSAMFLVSIAIIAMAVGRSRGGRILPAGIALVLIVLSVAGFRSSPGVRADGPEWDVERDKAVAVCATLSEDAPIDIAIAPHWVTSLTCDDLK